ncbi:unnamed protein product [Urochloa humidicola]
MGLEGYILSGEAEDAQDAAPGRAPVGEPRPVAVEAPPPHPCPSPLLDPASTASTAVADPHTIASPLGPRAPPPWSGVGAGKARRRTETRGERRGFGAHLLPSPRPAPEERPGEEEDRGEKGKREGQGFYLIYNGEMADGSGVSEVDAILALVAAWISLIQNGLRRGGPRISTMVPA